MAGVRLELEIDDAALVDAIDGLARQMRDLRPVFADIGEYLVEAHHRRFLAQRAPDGTPWAPLAPASVARKRRHAGRILWLDGYLAGLPRYNASAQGLVFGSGRVYGAVHQFGAARGAFGRTRRGAPIPWGDIPARPWLGLSDQDVTEIQEILASWIEAV